MHSAVGGVSKAQVIRTFKQEFNCTDDDINAIIRLCSFRVKPKKIDYKEFYKLPIEEKTDRIFYPFTQIYTKANFLSDEECAKLIAIIDQNLRPSTVSNPTDEQIISNYRTSKSSDLPWFHDPFYYEIDEKISSFMDLKPLLGEIMQAQRYAPGEYYKEHCDFYDPFTKEYGVYCEWMGQRTWTTMIYLNDVEEGGETHFKHLKLKIKPRKGMIVVWNNLYKNGFPNYKTLHEALPPISGNKYVITKWWRSWSLI
jgi:prolyl 4-hydroxylase